MLIDTQRIEDFLKTHNCHITSKGQTLEDKITYADFATNRYESVFEQLQTDIEVEKLMMHLRMCYLLKIKMEI